MGAIKATLMEYCELKFPDDLDAQDGLFTQVMQTGKPTLDEIILFVQGRRCIIDIGSGKGYPAGALSNFAPHPFVFRGIEVASMEGLLQSLKFSGPEMQAHVCTLVGRAAKSKGANKNWKERQTLYWQGQEIKRESQEYQDLLDEAFKALFDQNESARKALLATGEATLEHSIGKKSEKDTVLTRSEFCSRLVKNRVRLSK
jgi:predicted NAD-dependent protein-ADP-ribosyltransferase YbiA (DUF1768 family)